MIHAPYGTLDPNCNGPADQPATRITGDRFPYYLPAVHILTTGVLGVSFNLRIDEAEFQGEGPAQEYCYPVECGAQGAYEWAFRLYRQSADRSLQLSAYAFNYDGGFGAGARSHSLAPHAWYRIGVVFNYPADLITMTVSGNVVTSGERCFTYHKGLPDERRIFPRAVGPGIRIGGRVAKAPISINDFKAEEI